MFELRDGTRIVGQFSAVQIRWLGKEGRLKPNMEIRTLPSGGWNPITHVRDLQIAAPCSTSSEIAPPPASTVQAVIEGPVAAKLDRDVKSAAPPWGIEGPPAPIVQNRSSSDAKSADKMQHGADSRTNADKTIIRLCLVSGGLCFIFFLVGSIQSASTIDPPAAGVSQDGMHSLTDQPESISLPDTTLSAPVTPTERYYRDDQGNIMSETEAEQKLERVRSRIRSMPDNLERAYMEGMLRSLEEEWAHIKQQGPVAP